MKSMVKKIMIVMLAAVLVSASAVMADEGDSSGNSLGDLISSIIPEDFNLDDALGGIKSQLSDVTGKLGGAVEGVLGMITDGEGSLDTDKITGMIGTLFSSNGEEGEGEEAEEAVTAEEYYMSCYEEVDAAIERHLHEETQEYLEDGDECIVSMDIAAVDADEDGTIRILGYFLITNYDADGADLSLKNGSGNIELLTLTLNEEGTHDVTDFMILEDGEDFEASLEPMCEEMGITIEEFYVSQEFTNLTYVSDLYAFLADHPEYERIEYQEELLTMEGLDAVLEEMFDEMLAEYDLQYEETEEPLSEE